MKPMGQAQLALRPGAATEPLALGKGQEAIPSISRDIRGEARLTERAFGPGARALNQAMHRINERLEEA